MLPILKKIFAVGKKAFLVIIVYLVVVGVFVSSFSHRNQSKGDYLKWQRAQIYKNINDPELKKTPEGRMAISLYRQYTCKGIGEACTDNPDDADKNFGNSFVGKTASVITYPIANLPASGVYWAKDTLENSGFIPKTYAAEGVGFAGLKPFLNLWKIFRDLSYMILVLVLIAIGFMIMFRMKLNPQTVISVENALPKIVVSMILITFSFAIAGFIIDMMYVLIALGISILSNNNAFFDAGKFQNQYFSAGMGDINSAFYAKTTSFLHVNVGGKDVNITGGLDFLMYLGNAFLGMLGPFITGLVRVLSGLFGAFWIGPKVFLPSINWIGGLFHIGGSAAILGNQAGLETDAAKAAAEAASLKISQVVGLLFGTYLLPQLVIGLLIMFTILMTWFRIFFMLFAAYLQILLMVIFSPIFMLLDAVPGQNAFSGWLKGLIGELITFPVTIILLVTGYVIMNSVTSTDDLWTPPLLTGGMSPQAYIVLVGMGIMFLIPDLVKTVKDKIGVKPLPLSVGLGTFFGGAGAAVGGAMTATTTFSSLAMAFPILRTKLSKVKGIGGLFENPPTGSQPAKGKT